MAAPPIPGGDRGRSWCPTWWFAFRGNVKTRFAQHVFAKGLVKFDLLFKRLAVPILDGVIRNSPRLRVDAVAVLVKPLPRVRTFDRTPGYAWVIGVVWQLGF